MKVKKFVLRAGDYNEVYVYDFTEVACSTKAVVAAGDRDIRGSENHIDLFATSAGTLMGVVSARSFLFWSSEKVLASASDGQGVLLFDGSVEEFVHALEGYEVVTNQDMEWLYLDSSEEVELAL